MHNKSAIHVAKYSKLLVWISLLLMYPLPMYIMSKISYVSYVKNEYLISSLFFIVILFLVLIGVDSIFFKSISFYDDRVVKSWYLIGSITVYYSSAKIFGPPDGFGWLTSSFQIRKTNDSGKTLFIQIPIMFILFFIKKMDKKVLIRIINYLTDYSNNNPRVFKKNILHEEDICR